MTDKYDRLVKELRAMPVNPTMLLFVEGVITRVEAATKPAPKKKAKPKKEPGGQEDAAPAEVAENED